MEAHMLSRYLLLERAKQLRGEIEQIFLDAEHWNRLHPDEEPINADPDGKLRRLLGRLPGDGGASPAPPSAEEVYGVLTLPPWPANCPCGDYGRPGHPVGRWCDGFAMYKSKAVARKPEAGQD